MKLATRQYRPALVVIMAVAWGFAMAPVADAHSSSSVPTAEVTLNDQGFSPATIQIAKGTIVTWKIEGKNLHWPASNVHPTHQGYPGGGGCIGSKLDACRSLKAGETFDFTFDNAGTWLMHDHDYPQLMMKVVVADSAQTLKPTWYQKLGSMLSGWLLRLHLKHEPSLKEQHLALFSAAQKQILSGLKSNTTPADAADLAVQACADRSGTKFRDNLHCYTEALYQITSKTTTKIGFDTIYAIEKIDKSASSCHIIAHGVGWATYDKDPANWKVSIGKMNPACSYGGIHGIIEQYSASGKGDISKADVPTICGDQPSWGCLHGVGHILLVQEGDDLDKTIDLCSALGTANYRHHCLDGAFMEHMIAQNLVEHGLATPERRQYWYKKFDEFEKLCRTSMGEAALSCWTEIIHAAAEHFKGDAKQVMSFCNTAETKAESSGCRRHALDDLIARTNYNLVDSKFMCDLAPADDPGFKQFCYRNLAMGAISNLPPSPSNPAFKYCTTLDTQYQHDCFGATHAAMVGLRLSSAGIRYSCQLVPTEFLADCQHGLRQQPILDQSTADSSEIK